MGEIKSFFYLDEYKMYSISSQIFEGVTEHLTNFASSSEEESKNQSGPFGSGRVIAEILRSESASHERKYLHDFSYTLFERYLHNESKVLSISRDNIGEVINLIDDAAFVVVRSKAIFNDMRIITSILDSYNKMGAALTYVTNIDAFDQGGNGAAVSGRSQGDRNRQARTRQRQQALETTLQATAKAANLYMDPAFLGHLKYLLEYGFHENFEVKMPVSGFTFSANLRREYIREDEQLFVTKYSRFSEKEFVLFGVVAQCSNLYAEEGEDDPQGTTPGYLSGAEENEGNSQEATPVHMKEAVMTMVGALSNFEATYSGRMPREIIIDPIAIYREL